MTNNQHFLKRLRTAFLGLTAAFKEEQNFKIQFIIGIVVVFFMVILGLSAIEKSILMLMILVVLSLELTNSQIEKFLDLIEPDHHPRVRIIKDFSAGAVLLSAIGSIIIGLLIFLPHMIRIIESR